ncbi:hypothetical protein PHET_11584 [Paragonimus heterotremus]|uniref:Uncharacterized protein n=1 Tax=Paragonimus heterotremus TaxID=100268 RepID=A0A8J4T0Q5_9TREM|nr:hypothetical protein PHET_11584 [Paragonimus heterotremus]
MKLLTFRLKMKNWRLLITRKHGLDENRGQFLKKLRSLAKDYNLEAAVASQYVDDVAHGVFFSGLTSYTILQSLLDHNTLKLKSALDVVGPSAFTMKQSLLYHDDGVPANCM